MDIMESTKQDLLKTFYPTFIGVLIGLLLGGLLWIVVRSPRGNTVSLLPPPTPAPLVVDVAGAVPRPGVYELAPGSRIKDALEMAGGFLAQADKSTLNLAEPLQDGQKLDVPFIAGFEPTPIAVLSVGNSDGNGGSRIANPESLININTATVEELDALPGIGPALAQRIIDYRDTFGLFFAIEDIMLVDGIGEATFEEIKDLIITGFEE